MDLAPVYSEHKATTFPYMVKKDGEEWVRADSKPLEFKINLEKVRMEAERIKGKYGISELE